jgi:hypothetical protein
MIHCNQILLQPKLCCFTNLSQRVLLLEGVYERDDHFQCPHLVDEKTQGSEG